MSKTYIIIKYFLSDFDLKNNKNKEINLKNVTKIITKKKKKTQTHK